MEERLGIIGAGAIACGLAATAAQHGEVLLWARSPESLARAEANLDKLCGKHGDEVRERVTVGHDLEETCQRSFVVEAIAEDLHAKCALLAELGSHAPRDTILASTTSSLSVAALAAASDRPGRFAALHVFNPVPRMELVELCFTDAASHETRERTHALCAALGKTAIEVPDVPGFVVNRLLFPFLFSAVELLDQTGMDPKDVDTCMNLGAGHPMGPLALLDFVGLDVAVAIGETIGTHVPQRVRDLVAEGRLGRKAKAGFYDY